MKKFLSIVFVGVLLSTIVFSVPSSSYDAEQATRYVLNTNPNPSESNLARQAVASEQHSRLLESFLMASGKPAPETANNGELTYSGLTAEQYPPEYAGAYINANGDLVVMVTEGYENRVSAFKQAARTNALIYQTAKYSYSELLKIMDKAFPFLGNNEYGFELVSTAVDDYNNCVTVSLKVLNESAVDSFKQFVSDSSAIVFRQAEGEATMETSLNAGTKAQNLDVLLPDGTPNSASIGFRCRRSVAGGYQDGFVTAKHFANTGDRIASNSTQIGSCTLSYDVYDCAFVNVTNANYTISNTIGNTGKYLMVVGYAAITQGANVYKYGIATYEKNGQILNSSANVSVGIYTRPDCFISNYKSLEGDSGGTVYRPGMSSDQMLAGIHLGRADGYAYAAKASNIVNLMNLTRY